MDTKSKSEKGNRSNKLANANKKIEEAIVTGYQAIEDNVVSGYKAIEDGVVSGYKKIEDKFVETFLTSDTYDDNLCGEGVEK